MASKTALLAALALLVACLLASTTLCNARESVIRSSPQRCSKHSFSQEQLQLRPLRASTEDSPSPSSLSLSAAAQRKASLFYRDLCLFPYALVPGYISAQPSVAEAVRATRESKILYYCNDSTTAFYFAHHLKNTLTQRVFDAQRLLGLLKGKTLTFLGDSTARQVYMDLLVELLPFQTKMIDFNTTHAIANPPVDVNPHSGDFYGRLRTFESSNTTIVYCQHSRFESVLTREARFACDDRVSRGDFIVLAAGAWFRPYAGGAKDFPKHADALAMRRKMFLDRIRAIRAEITQLNPHAKVIWRLVPHVGAFDELFAAKDAGGIDPAKREMYKKNNWDSVSLVAKWVLVYNDDIRTLVASEYPQDALWDVFTVSAKFIDFANQQPEGAYKVHEDATHYCPGGAMRASLLLLEEIIGREQTIS